MAGSRYLGITSKKKAKSTEKLSSGYRINRAADDAAGLSISEKMRSQIRGLSRGIQNAQEGVLVCQVADGALSEVSKMLHRITELSVQAANDTNLYEDRKAIHREVSQILQEIDRIGDTTEYNKIPLFKGANRTVSVANTGPSLGDIPFQDYSLPDVQLGTAPFFENSNGDHLALQAIVSNVDSVAYKKAFNLIYGNGSTSDSSFRLNYITVDENGNTISAVDTIKMDSLQAINYNYDSTGNIWSRTFQYTNIDNGIDINITQNVSIEETSDTEKNYIISYEFANNSLADVKLDFLFHADTAYNNNDRCEAYYVDGEKINTFRIYGDESLDGTENSSNNGYENIPPSFSIVDADQALAFSEKIEILSASKPDTLSIGIYSQIHNWDYYKDVDKNYSMGGNAIRQDLGFSMIWKDKDLTAGGTQSYSFKYGIIAIEVDNNLTDVEINKDKEPVKKTETVGDLFLWIQSGFEKMDGRWLTIDRMNTDVLGIRDLNLTTWKGTQDALIRTETALRKVNDNRSKIGAQQNRLEHIISNELNMKENLQASESRIRDLDMASEIVNYTKHNILEQASQAILAQSNHSSDNVLSLLLN